MRRCRRRITKEQYERALENGGHIYITDRPDVFSESERFGYGVYSDLVFKRDGEYLVSFLMGETCD